ncbi:DUF1302 domain-containing protein [Methylibium sp. Root1272]|uniref:DUF1302 domain-containing protein n=1 Tax=Methylibium sp. Root1272 TaxID=1736441 RepID=UPI0006FC1321|nr:DUF1302 domain-containing protein [Methylibium sp. Root1272]KQW69903.1 hypothetical protein ASC67_05300 [Methylibium sp. Root1272]
MNHFSPARRGLNLCATAVAAWLACAPGAHALDLSPPDSDVKVRWDNTFKYSAGFRVKNRSPEVIAAYNPNLDDGDQNFDKGLISNRLDLLSELDVVYKRDLGLRISAAAWYDSVYNGDNDNPGFGGGAVPNPTSVPPGEFTRATREHHGRDVEVLDAFVFGKTNLGDMQLTGRLGRHTLLWGESLFFGDNGIAGGQAPVDLVKLLTVPGSQFKEIIRPVGQASTQLQISPTLSLGAYVQFEWERSRIPASGSYLSRADLLDVGGEQLYLPPFLGGPVPRTGDMEAKNSGQGGVQLRWRSEELDTDFGFYAIRFHDKLGTVVLRPGRDYNLAFHEGTRMFGMSASKSIGSFNVGAEVSVRRNASLVAHGGLVVDVPGTTNNSNDPAYPVGNTAHAQVSVVHVLERTSLWDGGLLLAEVAWHRRTSVTKNAAALDPNATRDATGLRVLFMPTLYQALPGVDLTIPVGLGYNPKGRSSVIPLFNGGWDKSGDFSIGLSADVQQTWKAGINYTHYFGKAGGLLDENANYSFRQSLKDRNFVSLSVQRTF